VFIYIGIADTTYIVYAMLGWSTSAQLDNIFLAIQMIDAILNPKNMLFYFSLTGLLLEEQSTSIHKATNLVYLLNSYSNYT